MLSCDGRDEDQEITDVAGPSLELNWDETTAGNAEAIGLVLYGPESRLLYQGPDSVGIPNHLPDGQFVCQVEIQSELDKTDYRIEVRGINDKNVYTFKDSFNDLDPVGFKKTALFIIKTKDSYTIAVP